MAYIDTIGQMEATGSLARQYRAAEKRAGRVFKILEVQSRMPRALRASLMLYAEVTTCEGAPLSRLDRELIATVVSRANNCFY